MGGKRWEVGGRMWEVGGEMWEVRVRRWKVGGGTGGTVKLSCMLGEVDLTEKLFQFV